MALPLLARASCPPFSMELLTPYRRDAHTALRRFMPIALLSILTQAAREAVLRNAEQQRFRSGGVFSKHSIWRRTAAPRTPTFHAISDPQVRLAKGDPPQQDLHLIYYLFIPPSTHRKRAHLDNGARQRGSKKKNTNYGMRSPGWRNSKRANNNQ